MPSLADIKEWFSTHENTYHIAFLPMKSENWLIYFLKPPSLKFLQIALCFILGLVLFDKKKV